MATETTLMQDHSTCCDGRIDMSSERILGIPREYLGIPLHDGKNSSGALKRYILLYSTHFIKCRSFKR